MLMWEHHCSHGLKLSQFGVFSSVFSPVLFCSCSPHVSCFAWQFLSLSFPCPSFLCLIGWLVLVYLSLCFPSVFVVSFPPYIFSMFQLLFPVASWFVLRSDFSVFVFFFGFPFTSLCVVSPLACGSFLYANRDYIDLIFISWQVKAT